MESYKEFLRELWETEEMETLLTKLGKKLAEITEMRCYQALLEIKEILEEDTFTDAECFMRIEKIICTLEQLGYGVEGRHDFG